MQVKPFIISSITIRQPIAIAISTVIDICKQLTSKKIIIDNICSNAENVIHIRHVSTLYKEDGIECSFIISDIY